MRQITSLALLLLALFVAGCHSLGANEKYAYDAEPSMEQASGLVASPAKVAGTTGRSSLSMGDGVWENTIGASMDSLDSAFIDDFDVVAASAEQPTPVSAERLLVYSGRLDAAVGNVDEALDAARAMAEELGGYFQSLSDETITIRVPASRWEEALARVAMIGRILNRQIEAADVTEEVVDLRLRLRNSLALGKRLEELLQMAKTVEETLKVEKELNRIRTEIERLEGRLQFLSDRIAFSTLVIRFVEVTNAPTRPQALPFPWLRALGLNRLLGLSGGGR